MNELDVEIEIIRMERELREGEQEAGGEKSAVSLTERHEFCSEDLLGWSEALETRQVSFSDWRKTCQS